MWICIAPCREHTSKRRSGMARVLKGSHSMFTVQCRQLCGLEAGNRRANALLIVGII